MMNTGARNPAEVDGTAALISGLAPTTYQSLVQVGIL
jgi:hypothetical protein